MGRRGNSGKGNRRGSAGSNRASGADYLAKQAARAEVEALDDGLLIEHLVVGDGDAPVPGCTITLHQRAWLVDRTVIEDTFRDNRPETCALDECIAGFREGVLRMRVGGRARLYVPPELAWGRKGAGAKIGPNQVITFDLRLLAVD